MRRGPIGLVIAAPLLIVLAGQLASCRVGSPPADAGRARLDARAARVGRALDRLLEEAGAVARTARDAGVDEVASRLRPPLADRLEGEGVLRGGRFESWTGTPAEVALFGEPGSARVLSRGIRTSLLVRSEADSAGRTGVASFVLDIRASALRAQDLLPGSSDGISARWELSGGVAAEAAPRFDPGPPATLTLAWRAPAGTPLAAVVLEAASPSRRSAHVRHVANAWAGWAAAAGLLLLVARPAGPGNVRRLAAVAAALIGACAALAAGGSLEELLPRSLGSPSVYGRVGLAGLASSPAALFATALAAYVLLGAVARALGRAERRGRAAAMALPVAVAGIVAVVALADSLARDARARVPRLDPTSPAALLLALAAACLIAGVAELVVAIATAARRRPAPSLQGSRLLVAAVLVPVSLLFLVQLDRISLRMTDDRLRSEFAPLVLAQSSRRRIALVASVGESAADPRAAAALAQPAGEEDAFLAYELWSASDLFHEGFASSIDVYDAQGTRRGHFGFGFPQVGGARETEPRPAPPGGGPAVDEETVPAGASLLDVVHAETPVLTRSGAIAGRIVGHVLEDPSNLPFLPESATYLAALGGGSQPADAAAATPPDYVLYDEDGRVVVSTVKQPPAATADLRAAAASGRRATVTSGDVVYDALPLSDGRRLHLLLAPAPTVLGIAADAVRLILLGLAVLAASALATTLSGAGGAVALLDVVRGSFYRKLLAAVLVATVVPLVGLAFFLRAYIERRGEASLADSAAALVGAARRVVEDYQSVAEDDPTLPRLRINDQVLWWLRRVVGQEIHLYEGGVLAATSKPELFDSELLEKRLPGEVDREIVRGGQPSVVESERLGAVPLPVAYARVEERGGPADAVIAVPLVLEQRAFARAIDRLVEMLLLLTTALVALLAMSAAWITRSVSEPVRRLAAASRRIAGGDYSTPLATASRDEMGSLVVDFNRMAGALAEQRADLTRRRDYIEALLRYATTGVVSTDAEGRVVTINPAAEALLGGPAAPRGGELLLAALKRQETGRPLADALADPHAARAAPLEVDLASPDATVRLRVVRVPLPDPAGRETGSLILLDDVTSLMRSNQLAAWAEMARAIAHEIKNPLTPIQLSTEHVRRLLHDRGILPLPEIDACLDTIVRNVRELRDISGAFSTYAKIPDLALTPVDPAAFLRDVAAPYRTALPPGIELAERHAPAPPILADTTILGRAFVNLIENALQAMPSGGTLTIASGPAGAGEVVLSVTDTGVGLTAAARARLFTPYFSTKSAGTGLGLAIVRRVVLEHGGVIDVDSTPGRGTSFHVRMKEAPG
jgi:signal transduction histidine kinase